MGKNLAASFESLDQTAGGDTLNEERTRFSVFLLDYYMFAKNVYSSKDCTQSNLKGLFQYYTLVVIPGYKDSCVAIKYYVDQVMNLEAMINIGLQNGFYVKTEKNIL